MNSYQPNIVVNFDVHSRHKHIYMWSRWRRLLLLLYVMFSYFSKRAVKCFSYHHYAYLKSYLLLALPTLIGILWWCFCLSFICFCIQYTWYIIFVFVFFLFLFVIYKCIFSYTFYSTQKFSLITTHSIFLRIIWSIFFI